MSHPANPDMLDSAAGAFEKIADYVEALEQENARLRALVGSTNVTRVDKRASQLSDVLGATETDARQLAGQMAQLPAEVSDLVDDLLQKVASSGGDPQDLGGPMQDSRKEIRADHRAEFDNYLAQMAMQGHGR